MSLQLSALREVANQLRAQMDDEIAALVAGACPDFADYRRRVGRLSGLSEAIATAEGVEKAIFGEQED